MDEMTVRELNPSGVTGEGKSKDMLYREDITGPQGARYTLFIQDFHTKEDLKNAKQWLRENLDVVKIYTIKEKL